MPSKAITEKPNEQPPWRPLRETAPSVVRPDELIEDWSR